MIPPVKEDKIKKSLTNCQQIANILGKCQLINSVITKAYTIGGFSHAARHFNLLSLYQQLVILLRFCTPLLPHRSGQA